MIQIKKILFFIFLMIFLGSNESLKAQNKSTNSIILIETNLGNIKLMLYKETPKHRKNFLQLIENKHFDGTLFYRVIDDFVLQGGSQDSRNASPGRQIGYGGSNRTIESEFRPQFFHKRGALAAARQPDKVNVFKESDVSQFYLAQGRVYTLEELTAMERAVNKPLRKQIVKRYLTPKKRQSLDSLKKLNKTKEFREIANKIKSNISFDFESSTEKLIFSEAQKLAFTTVGGVPHLDKNYTVFGEVISGFKVMDKIAKLKTDKHDRPYNDVKMKVRILKY